MKTKEINTFQNNLEKNRGGFLFPQVDKQLRDYVAHITVNAVEEDVRRQYLIRTKRSQKKDKECKEQTDQTQFKSFVNGFLLHWEERVTKIKRLKEDYVSAC